MRVRERLRERFAHDVVRQGVERHRKAFAGSAAEADRSAQHRNRETIARELANVAGEARELRRIDGRGEVAVTPLEFFLRLE